MDASRVTFVASGSGDWSIDRITAVAGGPLAMASRLARHDGAWARHARRSTYIARRLYHGRDLGGAFHFLTWFEYAPEDARAFDELVGRLRATEEWRYVTRAIDIRLMRQAG